MFSRCIEWEHWTESNIHFQYGDTFDTADFSRFPAKNLQRRQKFLLYTELFNLIITCNIATYVIIFEINVRAFVRKETLK